MARDNHLYYKPTTEGLEKIERLRLKVIELDDLIDELVPNTGVPIWFDSTDRSKSISKTKLEECRMRAIEAIVRLHSDGPVNQI